MNTATPAHTKPVENLKKKRSFGRLTKIPGNNIKHVSSRKRI
jgi:hypothetical protein